MSTPLISFVLPCYNSSPFLQATLDSISAQTVTDFECIALDDGSTDDTAAILRAHAARDARFTVISRENRGLIATLNEGIAAARGAWIARMDGDDIAHPLRLEKQLAALQATGADVCGVGVRFIGGRSGVWLPPATDAALKAALLFNPPFAHPGVLARASLFKQHGYDPHARHAEDYALWCTLARAGARFTAVAEPLLDYRIHAGQITQTRRDEMAHTAHGVRLDYARFVLPVSWPDEDKQRFVRQSGPEQALTRSEWQEFCGSLQELVRIEPAQAPAFYTVWLDALIRTRGVTPGLWGQFWRLSEQLPPPVEEQGKWRRQRLRVLLGDGLYGLAKRLRGRA
ncbi:Glycosyltransferase involved in cell wall bisynthesis [Andreprevotia lacus DSM 23236]|jgi:hypothetical protein|uniref:Glycosyltransferase involved in cell wall bisynthesis n=1 Tax=Andreprevotia lacus DSM 23236 TaxID=1121001 RepID=A0A1W1XXP5_9NEIS|nr:glycosyltransferase family 2 protein [Andreprevotia lacus]SMC28672.1 Glycosyltransferase involved in cell wall bisynthesis [Andreprevotia lacus DSM 23236]